VADDKESNLRDMQTAFSWSGTAVHGWRYSGEDAAVNAFDATAAATQWNAVRPALLQLESTFGPDNFSLPAQRVRAGCESG
jgi:hypothetical protein